MDEFVLGCFVVWALDFLQVAVQNNAERFEKVGKGKCSSCPVIFETVFLSKKVFIQF